MELSEKVMMFLLFAVRLGIPVLVTFGIAYLYDRIAERWEPEATTNREGTMPISERETLVETCPICQRAEAACARWSSIPCWLALQLVEGQISDDCLLCQRFTDSDFETRQLAGA